MSLVPENAVTMDDVAVWYKTQAEMKRLAAIEKILRPKIFKHFFPIAEEGTNSFTMPDGYIVKGKRVVSRDVDEGTVNSFRQRPSEDEPSIFEKNNINPEKYFRYKPDLKLAEYRKVTAEELAILDQCLIIKDKMPQLEIVAPKVKDE